MAGGRQTPARLLFFAGLLQHKQHLQQWSPAGVGLEQFLVLISAPLLIFCVCFLCLSGTGVRIVGGRSDRDQNGTNPGRESADEHRVEEREAEPAATPKPQLPAWMDNQPVLGLSSPATSAV